MLPSPFYRQKPLRGEVARLRSHRHTGVQSPCFSRTSSDPPPLRPGTHRDSLGAPVSPQTQIQLQRKPFSSTTLGSVVSCKFQMT